MVFTVDVDAELWICANLSPGLRTVVKDEEEERFLVSTRITNLGIFMTVTG